MMEAQTNRGLEFLTEQLSKIQKNTPKKTPTTQSPKLNYRIPEKLSSKYY
jgi:hypothetical protein